MQIRKNAIPNVCYGRQIIKGIVCVGIILTCFFGGRQDVFASGLIAEDDFQKEQEWSKEAKEHSISANTTKEAVLTPEGMYNHGTNIIFFGDSCTHGYRDERVEDTFIYSYASVLSQKTGREYKNCAWYGASMAGTGQLCFYTQLMSVPNLSEYDIAVVQFGINDFCLHIPPGNYNSTDINTVCGALNHNINYIRSHNVEPLVIVPFYYFGQSFKDEKNFVGLNFNEYVEVIRKWCDINDVALLDFNTMFHISPANFDAYYMDYIHPNQTLQNKAADAFYQYVMTYGDPNPQVSDFVDRMYRVCLSREADPEGKKYWERKLLTNQISGIDTAYGFVFSKEMYRKNLTDEEFIEILYQTLLGRNSDSEGKAYWAGRMKNGMSREAIFVGFADSVEYRGICDSYHITLGTTNNMRKNFQPRDINYGITSFISRLYTKALGRDYDIEGLNHWCEAYHSKRLSIIDISTDMFFHSREFLNKNLDDEEFLVVLYHTFLDREPDAHGMEYWKTKLKNGMSRDRVIQNFVYSKEFGQIMKSYGV